FGSANTISLCACVPMPWYVTPSTDRGPPSQLRSTFTAPHSAEADVHRGGDAARLPACPTSPSLASSEGDSQSAQSQPLPLSDAVTTRAMRLLPVTSTSTGTLPRITVPLRHTMSASVHSCAAARCCARP